MINRFRKPHQRRRAKPVVALPEALATDAPPIRWPGEQPGLIRAPTAVAGGALEMGIGETTGRLYERLFEHLYLLNPAAHLRRS